MRTDRDRLQDILDAIHSIGKYAQEGRDRFEKDELIQNWIVHHLQIIGEASNKLSEDIKVAHPAVPWSAMIGMRNILVHEYMGIDLGEVWTTVEYDLPALQEQIQAIIDRT
jgi:uncharacterized protein with HEPN domain